MGVIPQNVVPSDEATVASQAEAVRTSGQVSEMQGNLDVNSMMTALDDYLKKAAEGDSGVPINYYLKGCWHRYGLPSTILASSGPLSMTILRQRAMARLEALRYDSHGGSCDV